GVVGVKPGLMLMRLSGIRYAARDVNLYEFRRIDGEDVPAARAGAHIDIHLPDGIVRQYSLVIESEDSKAYVIAVKREPDGRGGSLCIHDRLRVGDEVEISAPRNAFPLREDASHTV